MVMERREVKIGADDVEGFNRIDNDQDYECIGMMDLAFGIGGVSVHWD